MNDDNNTIDPAEGVVDVRRSPLPQTVKRAEMDFYVALRLVEAGRFITKLEWKNPEMVVGLKDTHLRIRLKDGKFHDLIVTEGDMIGKDWVVADE
jgi:hypothetical protein